MALRTQRVLRALYADAAEDAFKVWADCDTFRMKQMQAYIGLRGSHNVSEHSDIPDDQMKQVARLYQKPVHFDYRVPYTRWCVLRWPTPAMAQLAQMSTEAFEAFYFDVCTLDYARMETALRPLAGGERRDPALLRGLEVGMLCGLARPASLRGTLEGLGARVVAERSFPDHHRYRRADLAGLTDQAPLWITTEKDAVKITPPWAGAADLRVLSIELAVEEADAFLGWLERCLRS